MRKLGKGMAWVLGVLVVLAGVGRALIYQPWTIPPNDAVLDASMAPTLRGGDLVLLMSHGKAAFGDLVRCPDPEDPTGFVVGRVTGTQGDSVEVVGNDAVVNHHRYGSEMACAQSKFMIPHPKSGSDVNMRCDVVNMGSGWHYRGASSDPVPQSGKNIHGDVGSGMLYLLSDDRSFHDDSRDFGTVPANTCQRIFFRLWSKSGWGDDAARLSYIR
jgi:signal peptidase I